MDKKRESRLQMNRISLRPPRYTKPKRKKKSLSVEKKNYQFKSSNSNQVSPNRERKLSGGKINFDVIKRQQKLLINNLKDKLIKSTMPIKMKTKKYLRNPRSNRAVVKPPLPNVKSPKTFKIFKHINKGALGITNSFPMPKVIFRREFWVVYIFLGFFQKNHDSIWFYKNLENRSILRRPNNRKRYPH